MLEYLGYLASVIVLVSLLMSSIKKLRWVNLLGSITFATYGFLIGSLPVGFLNIGTVIINIYYLTKMYTSKDYFTLLPITTGTQFFDYFIDFNKKDIEIFFPNKKFEVDPKGVSFYILRNAVPAGLFVSSYYNSDTLKIELDYVTSTYRDFKMGSYIFMKQKEVFLKKGFTSLITFTSNPKHEKYLAKMGFVKAYDLSNSTEMCYRIDLNK